MFNYRDTMALLIIAGLAAAGVAGYYNHTKISDLYNSAAKIQFMVAADGTLITKITKNINELDGVAAHHDEVRAIKNDIAAQLDSLSTMAGQVFNQILLDIYNIQVDITRIHEHEKRLDSEVAKLKNEVKACFKPVSHPVHHHFAGGLTGDPVYDQQIYPVR